MNHKPPRAPQIIRDLMHERPLPGHRTRLVDRDLHISLLIGKIHSEIEEVARDLQNPEEYADALESILSLARINGVDLLDIEAAREKKAADKGGFLNGVFWSRLPEVYP